MAGRAGKSKGADGEQTPPNPDKMEHPHNAPTREELAYLRLRHVAGIRAARDLRIAANEIVKDLRKKEKILRNAYENDGFSLKILDEAFEREDTPGRNLVKYEQERHDLFEDMGQTVYIQVDLFEQMGDETYWGDAGRQAGLAGKIGTPPSPCPPEFHQAWQKGWVVGQDKLAWSMADKGINPDAKKAGSAGTGPTAGEIARKPEPVES